MKHIRDSRNEGCNYLEFVGGEPTIRKDFLILLKYAKSLKFKTIMFATNGRVLSNRSSAKKIIDAGANHIVFSIHGYNAELHDNLTRVRGSFDECVQGIDNLKQLGFDNIGTNTTIVKQNFQYLMKIGKFIYSLGIDNSEFIFVDPEYMSDNDFDNLVPYYEDVSPFINDLLSFGKARNRSHWDVRYYLSCLVSKDNHSHISEEKESKIFKTKHIAPDFINENVSESRKNVARTRELEKCKTCKYSSCEGPWKKYVERRRLDV